MVSKGAGSSQISSPNRVTLPPWRQIAIVAAAAVAVVALLSLRGGGPIQGGSGTIMFSHTPISCSFMMELQVGDAEFGNVDLLMEADGDGHCVVIRQAGDYHATGRASVFKSIEAAGEAIKR